jgi:CubicO group peptidase (beta-lactamase class C family)
MPAGADALAVNGHCDPAFEPVREAFRSNFEEQREVGAAVAVQIDGRTCVDLWAGLAARADRTLWTQRTLVNVYSTTKGLAALCVQRLVDAAAIDLEQTVAHHWPEFAAAGKAEITVAQLLGHRAGLAALRERLPHEAIYDQARMARALAEAAPLWEPGTKHAYHAQTFGFLLAELVRRTTGRTLGQYFREQIAGPLGADAHIGLAAEDDARVAKLTRPLGEHAMPGEMDLLRVQRTEPESLTALAFSNPQAAPGAVNSRRWRGAEIPSSNGHASAIGLATVYGAVAADAAGGGRVLSAEGVARCAVEYSYGQDEVLRLVTRFGPGFMLSQPSGPGRFGPNPRSFGHPGLGGSIGFADPDAGLGFGYVMNRAGPDILVGERPRRLIDAVYACL